MKRSISLILVLLLALGSLGALAACDTPDDIDSGAEVTTHDRTPFGESDTTEKPDGPTTAEGQDSENPGDNSTTEEDDPFDKDGQDSTGSDTQPPENGDNEKPLNYTVDYFENFNEGIVLYSGTMTLEDGTEKVGYGYIDSKGQVITPPIFEKAYVFYKGLAAVKKGENQF